MGRAQASRGRDALAVPAGSFTSKPAVMESRCRKVIGLRAGSLSSSARALLLARALVGAAAPAVEADALGIDLPALGEAWGEARSEGLFARDGTAVDDDRLLPLVARALRRAVPAPEQAEVVRRVDEARARAGMASVEVVRALDALERGRSDDALVAADRIRAAPDTSDPDRDLAVWLSVTVLSGRGLHSDAEAVAGSQGTPRSRELAAFVRLLGGTPPDELPGGDERAPVADFYVADRGADLHDLPAALVADDPRALDLRHAAVPDVEIGAADRGGGHPEDRVVVLDDPRDGDLVEADMLRPMVDQSHHLPRSRARLTVQIFFDAGLNLPLELPALVLV